MRNKLMYGADAPRMLQDAFFEARETLGSDNLLAHPDYLFIEPAGKKSIGVDEVLPIVSKGMDRPVLASVAVVIINNFDKLTVPAQNKLLLTLEANENVLIIGIAKDLGSILDTVKSRMQIVEYKKAKRDEFSEFEMPDLAYNAYCGDLRMAERRRAEYEMVLSTFLDCQNNPRNLLKTLHLLEEKDPQAVTADREFMTIVLRAMKHAFVEKSVELAMNGDSAAALIACDCVSRLDDEEALMRRVSYGKDDFFLAIVDVIEKNKNREVLSHGTL